MRARAKPSASARASLAMLLTNATDEKFVGFSVDKLAAMNSSPREEIKAMLYAEQQRRRARAR